MDLGLVAFAFAAGAAAFFAPCSVAMLPAYVAFAVRPAGEGAAPRWSPASRALGLAGLALFLAGAGPLLLAGLAPFVPALGDVRPPFGPSTSALVALAGAAVAGVALARAGGGRAAARGALFGGLASLGILAVFLVLGLPVALLARGAGPFLARGLPVLVGLALAALGALALAGRAPTFVIPGLRADVTRPRGFVLFGAAYGLASLGCTFPVFLSVVFAGLLTGGALAAVGTFASFAAGQAAVLVATTAVVVAGGEAAGARMRRAAPYVARASGGVLVLAGLYVAWYYGRGFAGGA